MSAYRILFGDIHNHNAHGYGVGSIERSLESRAPTSTSSPSPAIRAGTTCRRWKAAASSTGSRASSG